MPKPILHPYMLDIEYSVQENMDFPEREDILVKVSEYISELDDSEDTSPEEHQENNYLQLHFTRIILDDQAISHPFDILDSASSELVTSVYPIIREENEEIMSEVLGIDTNQLISKVMYLHHAKIYGEFSEDAIAAATSKAFKMLAKGTPEDEWVAVLYKKHTFFNNGTELDTKKSTTILKQLNTFNLPHEISGIKKSDNILSIASGNFFNKELREDDKLINKTNPKVKP